MSEKIEVGYRNLSSQFGVDYHHKFLLYTDKTGQQHTISGWTGEPEVGLPMGNIRVKSNWDYDSKNTDNPLNPNAIGQKQYRETIIEAPDLSTKWGEMIKNAQSKDNIYPYDITRQNSNTLADSVLRDVGLPEPKLDGLGIGNHLAPASGNQLDRNIVPKAQKDLGLSDIGDVISLEETNIPHLAVNANSKEVVDYAFVALLSDDPVAMEKGLDQVFKTNVAQENMQQANEAVIAYDNQQAQIQQIENPARVMRV